jgi:23S rRNA pseudouridine1911/1915/1917 synthase
MSLDIKEASAVSFEAGAEDAGLRLDAFLAGKIDGWSRSRLQRLIDDGDVLVNEKAVKSSYKIREKDEIEVELTEIIVAKFEPENIPLDIVYEDENLAVINKSAGMVVHPGAGVQNGTLANAVAYHFGIGNVDIEFAADVDDHEKIQKLKSRIGIVHRLDKDTSGLIVVAKNEEVHEALSAQFRDREVFKSYVALVHGSPRENSGKIEAHIARNKHNRLRMKVGSAGRYALSLWKVRQRFGKFTLLEVEIKTGRTHQIRVHLGYINFPVVGDEIYNEGRDKTVADIEIRRGIEKLGRFFLHAEKLSFTHPKTGEKLEFVQPLPAELEEFLNILSG